LTEVIVIGGGVIGSALTFRLAQAGAKVTLLEAKWLASGTSGATFAWTNSNNKSPLAYHQLNVGGMAEHEILRAELGYTPWFHQDGNLEWVPPDQLAKQREKVDRLREWGYHAEWLTPAEVKLIEPNLEPPPDVEQIAYYPAEGYIDAPLFVGGMVQAAERHGATVRTQTPVTEVVREAGRAAGVVTADGEHIGADVVVSCIGRWSDELAKIAGVEVPMAPDIGMIALTEPSGVIVRAVVHEPGLTMRTDGAGRMMIRSAEHDKKVDLDTPTVPVPELCNEILERAVARAPKLKGVPLEAARITKRSIPKDSYPMVGPLPGWEGLYIIATHSGVTMAPLLARLLTREILDGQVDERLATFRPERLAVARQTM
jgi:glycine/D-amino acid oxidase-like deaminating enzyme